MKKILMILMVASIFSLVACGSSEEEKAATAVEDLFEGLEEEIDAAGDAVEGAADAVEGAADAAGDAVEGAVDAAGDAVEEVTEGDVVEGEADHGHDHSHE